MNDHPWIISYSLPYFGSIIVDAVSLGKSGGGVFSTTFQRERKRKRGREKKQNARGRKNGTRPASVELSHPLLQRLSEVKPSYLMHIKIG